MDVPERDVRSFSVASLRLAMVADDNNKRALRSTLEHNGRPYTVVVTSDLKFMALLERLTQEEPSNELWLSLLAMAGPVTGGQAGGEA